MATPSRSLRVDVFFMSVSEIKVIEPERASSEPAAPEKHVVLALENVSKRFCRDLKRSLFYGVQDIAREVVGLSQAAEGLRPSEFWAVQDVNLELRSGDVLGIVGINGCGKTTLMRIIAGLIKPTIGRVIVRGRLAPLLALGAGFNPILTGRENVFANMAILGLTFEEIQDRFDDVVAFSEIGYAIDAPVQTYSSGMVARLGFACAVNTQPDILLLDEVLAVGDMNFRRKCLERLFAMRAAGVSILMVHHSPSLLLSIAESALYLRKGRVVVFGPIIPVIQKYESDLVEAMSGAIPQSAEEVSVTAPVATSEAEIIDVVVESVTGEGVVAGEDAVLRAHFKVNGVIDQLSFVAQVIRLQSMESIKANDQPKQVLKMVSRREGGSASNVQPGEYEVRIDLPAIGLRGGVYQVNLKLSRPIRVVVASRNSMSFVVTSNEVSNSEYFQQRSWSIISRDGSRLHTEKILNSIEAADDLMDLEDKEKPE
jgi:lipopolysaccharide transport system ATP-binding protein